LLQPSEYKDPITIQKAIDNIDNRTFLLPAIQRNFVWSTQQICGLFDSMMRGYPINTFMAWNVATKKIKNDHKFYSFLSDYCERFRESNDEVRTQGRFKDFLAIVDGQQRLTSIYIGLKGSYAYKQPRIHWPAAPNDDVLPPRQLYLDLSNELIPEDNEGKLKFHFRFLTKDQAKAYQTDPDQDWFRVGEILNLKSVDTEDTVLLDVILPYLQKRNLSKNKFAVQALNRLYFLVQREKVIRYYQVENQNLNHVLDIFIRTNSGGSQLEFADLLMSIAVASWDGDARNDIDGLVKEVRQDVKMSFSIGRDWVLKTCLMLTDADIKFRVQNFGQSRVETIQKFWPKIRACLIETFKLLRLLGMDDHSIRAKNAIIPIAYYLFRQTAKNDPLYTRINNLAYHREERLAISKWLNMALLKGVFGGQSDAILAKMQSTIKNHLHLGRFPLQEIISSFENSNKDLRFDKDYLETLIEIEHGDSRCRSVLSLIFPEMNDNQLFDIDHLHPRDSFKKGNLKENSFLKANPDKVDFYSNKKNWNSILNLHLLNFSQNRQKGNKSLKEWLSLSDVCLRNTDLLLEMDSNLGFEDFEEFCKTRQKVLLRRLRKNVILSPSILSADVDALDEDDDNQVTV